jgi:hypothetical protein
MLTFDAVRELGGSLPEVVDGTAYGAPALKLHGKLLACVPTNKSADVNSIVVRIDPQLRAELLRQNPEVYYITDHYAPHPTVLVRLSRIARGDLKALLQDAHRFVLSEQQQSRKVGRSKPSPRSVTRRKASRPSPSK